MNGDVKLQKNQVPLDVTYFSSSATTKISLLNNYKDLVSLDYLLANSRTSGLMLQTKFAN